MRIKTLENSSKHELIKMARARQETIDSLTLKLGEARKENFSLQQQIIKLEEARREAILSRDHLFDSHTALLQIARNLSERIS